MKLLKKLTGTVAVSLALASSIATAAPVFLNVSSFEDAISAKNNLLTDGKTAVWDEAQVNWSATSVYTDTNGSGGVNVGDAVLDSGVGTFGGFLLGGSNLTTFEQNEGINGFYAIRFNYTNLAGTVVAMLSPSQILAQYTSGTIDIWADTDNNGTNDTKLMTLDVFNSDGTIGNFNIYTKVSYAMANTWFFPPATDFTNVPVVLGFIDTNLTGIGGTAPGVPTQIGSTNQYTRTSTLNGSAHFVPEPASVALIGLGLLGLGLSRRTKKAA